MGRLKGHGLMGGSGQFVSCEVCNRKLDVNNLPAECTFAAYRGLECYALQYAKETYGEKDVHD